MRSSVFLFLFCLNLGVFAAEPQVSTQTPSTPMADEPVDEPQVTIVKQKELTIEEYRANGKLYMIKITPKVGAPYYLVDDLGDGRFARHEGLDSGLRVPRWIIKKF